MSAGLTALAAADTVTVEAANRLGAALGACSAAHAGITFLSKEPEKAGMDRKMVLPHMLQWAFLAAALATSKH